MGTIIPRKAKDGSTRYRAQIRITKAGKLVYQESDTFSTRALAKAWLARREAELEKPGAIEASRHKVTIREVLAKYREATADAFGKTKSAHIRQMESMPLADLDAVGLTTPQLMEHVADRRKDAGPATVANDLIWLRVAFRWAKHALGLPLHLEAIDEAAEAARHARLIAKPKRRDRRPTPEELEKLDAHFAKQRFRKDGTTPDMRLVMWFAIYSSRRQSEIVSVRIEDMDEASSTYLVRDLKHPDGSEGNNKHALLPPMGWVVAKLAIGDRKAGRVFPWSEDAIQRRFQDACKVLQIRDLRFHDLRHEALSRLAEDGATIPQIQQVSLHESWGSLQIYVNVPAKRQRRVDFTPPAASR